MKKKQSHFLEHALRASGKWSVLTFLQLLLLGLKPPKGF
jgi:hypothetical protein